MNGTPITWTVLRSENGRALLISNQVVSARSMGGQNWSNSSLRVWLNGVFLQECFTETERSIFVLSEITNAPDSVYEAASGPDTKDIFYVLSGDEARELYYTKEDRMVRPMQQALAEGIRTSSSGNCSWWLRTSAAEDSDAFMVVNRDGGIGWSNGSAGTIGVRPVVWINLYAPALGFLFTY